MSYRHYSHNYKYEASGMSNPLADYDVCKNVMGELEKHYPGHPWLVNVDTSAGWLSIQLGYTNAMGRLSKGGMLMHLSDLTSSTAVKQIMRYGGELLERTKLARRGHRVEDRLIALEGLDLTGIGR